MLPWCFVPYCIAPEIKIVEPVDVQDVYEYGQAYGLPKEKTELMVKTIKCESEFNSNAVGDNGNSYGLVQIHLPSHPYITKEQALDPDFALKFIADNFKEGNERLWTCARKHS